MDLSTIENIGENFQKYTKYRYVSKSSKMSLGVPAPDTEKKYASSFPMIILPAGETVLSKTFKSIDRLFRERRSRRAYSEQPISLEQLAALLWATQGIIEHGPGYSYRTVPSAGARHPLETYLVLNRVENQPIGLYNFQPYKNRLVCLKKNNKLPIILAEACLGQTMLVECAVSFIWTAVIERSRWKYQHRAYRYIYLDAGHICQNLYLASEALEVGCCAVAAFDDDAVNEIVGIDGREEFAIYLATVGFRR